MRPNSIGKFVQKMYFYYTVIIRTRHQLLTRLFFLPQLQLQCDMLLRHSLDIIYLKVGYQDFQLRDAMLK